MIRKGQLSEENMPAYKQFMALVGQSLTAMESECGDKIKGHPTRRQVIWSLCSDTLLGRGQARHPTS
jgi:hypothetical protein